MNWFSPFFFSFFSLNHFCSAIVIELLVFRHWAFGSSQKGVCCPIYHCGCRRNWHLAWHFFYSIDCSWNVQQVGLLVETSQGWEITNTCTQIMIKRSQHNIYAQTIFHWMKVNRINLWRNWCDLVFDYNCSWVCCWFPVRSIAERWVCMYVCMYVWWSRLSPYCLILSRWIFYSSGTIDILCAVLSGTQLKCSVS